MLFSWIRYSCELRAHTHTHTHLVLDLFRLRLISSKENILSSRTTRDIKHTLTRQIALNSIIWQTFRNCNGYECSWIKNGSNESNTNERALLRQARFIVILMVRVSLAPSLHLPSALFKLLFCRKKRKRSEDKKNLFIGRRMSCVSTVSFWLHRVFVCVDGVYVCTLKWIRANKKGNSALRNNENNVHKYTYVQ